MARDAPPLGQHFFIFFAAVNPHLISNFGNNSIRRVKSDPADAKKIARYTLFWHVDCVRGIGSKAFTERYRAFCKREGYNFSAAKASELFEASKELVAVFPKEKPYTDLIEMSISQVRAVTGNVIRIRDEMNKLASTLPEYEAVISMWSFFRTMNSTCIKF